MKLLTGSDHREWGISNFTHYVGEIRDVYGYRPLHAAKLSLDRLYWDATDSIINLIEWYGETHPKQRLW